MLAFFRYLGSPAAGPVLYGLAGFILTLVGVRILAEAISRYDKRVTPDNIELKIQRWAVTAGLSIKKLPEVETTGEFFALEIGLPNGTPLQVYRPKDRPGNIVIQSMLELSPEYKTMLGKLSSEKVSQLVQELRVEMGRCRIGHKIEVPLARVILLKGIPITEGLTEYRFLQTIDESESDLILIGNTIVLGLARLANK